MLRYKVNGSAEMTEYALVRARSGDSRCGSSPPKSMVRGSSATVVLTDVMGMTGQAIIRAIVAGERDPKVLARHRHSRVKASETEIAKALTGNWRDEHLFVLRQALAMYDDIARHLGECDAKLQGLLSKLGACEVDLGKTPRAGSKTSAPVAPGCPSAWSCSTAPCPH